MLPRSGHPSDRLLAHSSSSPACKLSATFQVSFLPLPLSLLPLLPLFFLLLAAHPLIFARKLPRFRLDLLAPSTSPSSSSYQAGEYVEGNVVFTTSSPMRAEKLFLRLVGTESVHFLQDEEDEEERKGSTALLNRWYHGWENTNQSVR